MKKDNGQFRYSATDLAKHLGCTHLTELDRKVAEGLLKLEIKPDCATPQQMRLANGFCRYMEMAETMSSWG